MSYKSPIQLTEKMTHRIIKEEEDYILRTVRNVVADVDREALLKALQYDRNQYEQGYADGQKEAIPIEWIKKYYEDITMPYTDTRIQFEEMIRKWEKENEL